MTIIQVILFFACIENPNSDILGLDYTPGLASFNGSVGEELRFDLLSLNLKLDWKFSSEMEIYLERLFSGVSVSAATYVLPPMMPILEGFPSQLENLVYCSNQSMHTVIIVSTL
jgi:hypothetical protein